VNPNLQDAGFALDADDHLLYSGTSKPVRTAIEKEVAKQVGTKADVNASLNH
jgi:hypothetical protein